MEDKNHELLFTRCKLEDDKKELSREIDALREQITRLKEEKKLSEDEKTVMTERDKRLQQKCEKLTEEVKQLENKIRDLKAELVDSEKVRALECEKIRALQGQRVRELEMKLQQHKKRFEDLNPRVQRIQDQMEEWVKQLGSEVIGEKSVSVNSEGLERSNDGTVQSFHEKSPDVEVECHENVRTGTVIALSSDSDDEIPLSHKRKRGVGTGENTAKYDVAALLEPSDSTSESEEYQGKDLSGGPDVERKWRLWPDEESMVPGLKNNKEYCMRAVCALYRQDVLENMRLNDSNARRVFELGKYLTDCRPRCLMKKSVADLEAHDKKGIEDCQNLAISYSKRLFELYDKTSDHLFSPV